MEKTKKLLTRFFGIPLAIISFLFIAKIFYDSKDTFLTSIGNINFPLFLLGVLFFALFFLMKGLSWIEILKRSGHEQISRSTLFSYTWAETKRYIPGSIFGFAARVQSLSPHLPKRQIIKGIGVEALLFIMSASVVSFPSLYYFSGKTIHFLNIPQFTFFIAVVFLLIFGFAAIFIRFPRLFHDYFSIFLMILFGWFLFGLASLFVALSFGFINPNDFITVGSFFVFSWLIGYLAFIAPMGLGIRELVIVGGLSFFLATPVAVVIALFSRLAMILGELVLLVGSYYCKKIKTYSILLKMKPSVIILFASIFCFIAYFTFFTFLRHQTFHSGRFDLGNMSQTVWNSSRGHIFQLTNPDGTEIVSRLGIHADFLLVLLSPLYFIWADPRTLLIVQTVIVAFGAFYVYEIAVTILKKEKLSVLLAISFLLNFWVQEQVVFDFHAVTLATTFILAAFYYLLVNEKKSFYFFILLTVLTKENAFLIAALFGVFLFIRRKYVSGILLFTISLGVFYLLMSKFIPEARGNTHFAISYLSYLGDSPKDVIGNLVTKPQLAFREVFSVGTFDYFVRLFLPVGFLGIFAPLFLLFAAPDMAINILSTNINLKSHEYHYGALIVPFVYISTIYGIRFISKSFKVSHTLIFYYLAAATLMSAYLYSPLPGMKEGDIRPYLENSQKIHDYLALIPTNAKVAASNNIAAHLSNRDYIFVVPNGTEKADYVVFYNENPEVQSQFNSMDFTLIIQDGEFFLYKRGPIFCKQCKP